MITLNEDETYTFKDFIIRFEKDKISGEYKLLLSTHINDIIIKPKADNKVIIKSIKSKDFNNQ